MSSQERKDNIAGMVLVVVVIGGGLYEAARQHALTSTVLGVLAGIGFLVIVAGIGVYARRSGGLDHTNRKNPISGEDSWGPY